MPPDVLPRDARLIALLISATPSIEDAQPAVLHQLLEFAHRYTAQVLSDSLVYSEHAGRGGSVDEDDVKLAVQSRVGWEFGGKIPKEFIMSLATKTNAKPLPAVPEVFGIRLPPAKHCLTAIDFDVVPNKPPPGVKLNEEDDEDEYEDEYEDDDDDYDAALEPPKDPTTPGGDFEMADQLFAITPAAVPLQSGDPAEGGEEGEPEEDDLFGEEDDDEEMADAGDAASALNGLHPMVNGTGLGDKRKLDDEDDDYDA